MAGYDLSKRHPGEYRCSAKVAAVSNTNSIALIGVAIVAVLVAVIAAVIAVKALRTARAASRDYRRIAQADVDVVDVLLDRISSVDAATKTVEELAVLVQATRDDVAHSLRHVAVVKYDAFRDLAGRLSFSAAVLDDVGDGVILTSLHGRSQTQFIAKGVTAGDAAGLSPEEKQAVEYALKGVDQ